MTKRVLQCLCAVVLWASVSATSFAAEQLTKPLTAQVSVTGQMTLEKFSNILQSQQFKTVIVNRPDEEQANPVSFSQLKSLADTAQMQMVYQPVISGKMTAQNVQDFANAYNQLPKPILMVCRSGSRSTLLFNEARKLGLLNE